MRRIALRDIYLARQAIRGYAHQSPLVRIATFSAQTRGEVYLKPETLQETGPIHPPICLKANN